MKISNSMCLILISLILTACQIEPQAINFGKDQCHYCQMNIVDKQHAAQYVTKKGKQFKFDAIECMVNQLSTIDEMSIHTFLVSDYGKSKMTEAKTSTFLISKAIKSPMGANLSAFSTKEGATKALEEYSGHLYSWEELKKHIEEK